jgi:hypothetical protein
MTRRADLAELRRMPTPDLRRDIEHKIGRLPETPRRDGPSVHRKIVVLALTVLVTGGAFLALAQAFGGPARDRRTPGSSSAKPLMGDALAESLGLTKYGSIPGQELVSTDAGLTRDGELLTDCTTTEAAPVLLVVQVEDEDFFFCVRAATKLEAWEISKRLQGHVPTQSEIDEMTGEFHEGT